MSRKRDEAIVRELFATAGVTINGDRPYDVQVHDDRFYTRVFHERELGLGESYMDGWWDCDAVDQLVDRLLRARLDKAVKGDLKLKWYYLRSKVINLQTPEHAEEVARRHYDIGNDFYAAMLDRRMNYTCAYWRNARDLDSAQEAKLELVCRKLDLQPGMTVLELGCGWGAFAKYAAEKYGVRVTAVNISKAQVTLARELCKGLPVDVKLQDYREVTGTYDRVLSIGLMEHVGYKNYRTYLEVVDRNLKDDGIAFFHTIGGNTSVTTANAWTTKYIFPNGMIPSVAQLSKAMEDLFVMEDWHNFGPDYDKTLMAWYENFKQAWPRFRDKYGDRFYRMWSYYLLTSAAGFRSRSTQLWQVVMTKPGREQPDCRSTDVLEPAYVEEVA